MNAFKIIYKIIEWLVNLIVLIIYSVKMMFVTAEYTAISLAKAKEENEEIINGIGNEELFNKETGLLRKEAIIVNKALRVVNFGCDTASDLEDLDTPERREELNESHRRKQPEKIKGDSYELSIGRYFEKKSDNLVIYNGLINNFKDNGVDVIVISPEQYAVELIQCKNWVNRKIHMEDIEYIYNLLDAYNIGHFLNTKCKNINYYLKKPKKNKDILTALHHSRKFLIIKKLYIPSIKTLSSTVRENVTKITDKIYKYKNMQIIIKHNDYCVNITDDGEMKNIDFNKEKTTSVASKVTKAKYKQQSTNSKTSAIKAYELMQESLKIIGNSDIDKMIKAKLKVEAERMVEAEPIIVYFNSFNEANEFAKNNPLSYVVSRNPKGNGFIAKEK